MSHPILAQYRGGGRFAYIAPMLGQYWCDIGVDIAPMLVLTCTQYWHNIVANIGTISKGWRCVYIPPILAEMLARYWRSYCANVDINLGQYWTNVVRQYWCNIVSNIGTISRRGMFCLYCANIGALLVLYWSGHCANGGLNVGAILDQRCTQHWHNVVDNMHYRIGYIILSTTFCQYWLQ